MKTYIYSLFLVLLSLSINAQQLPLLEHYNEAMGVINPAYVDMDYLIYDYKNSIRLIHRNQWKELEDSPKTYLIDGQGLLERRGTSLLYGGSILRDQAGYLAENRFAVKAAGILSHKPDVMGISLGLSLAYVRYGIEINPTDSAAEDPSAPIGIHQGKIDVGAGIYAYRRVGGGRFSDNLIYGGLSIPQLLKPEIDLITDDEKDAGGPSGDYYSITKLNHFYAIGGYVKNLNDEFSYIQVSTWIRYVRGAKLSYNVDFKYQYSNVFYIGAGYGSNLSFRMKIGFMLDGSYSGGFGKVDLGLTSSSIFGGKNAGIFGKTYEFYSAYSF